MSKGDNLSLSHSPFRGGEGVGWSPPTLEIGLVKSVDIDQEMRGAYLDYAMSVITARALPDVRDGLKPVQRRILYAMGEMGLRHNAPYKKCARVVGDVLGRYHPHGDAAVYEALVRMAQDFTMRYTLVDGQGNFGSIDGDPPAAMRYCVTGDTLVISNQGLMPISRLSDGNEDVHLQVLSAGGRINAACKWFDSGEHPTLRLRTRHGYEVTGTSNHPLLTWQVGPDGRPAFAWKTMDTITPGDWLVLDRTPDILWPTEPVDLRGYHPSLPSSSRAQRHSLPEKLDSTLAFILGALIAEGYINDQRLEFDNLPGEFADRFRAAWETAFPTCRLHEFLKVPSSFGQQPYMQFQVVAKQVRLFLEKLGLEQVEAAKREVPEVILRSPKEIVVAFLQAYFESDGAVEQSGRSLLLISACSSSRKLLQQLQVLLLRFGIVSWLRPDRPGTYKLSIRGKENVARFAQEIGFVSQRKQEALQSILARLTGRSISKSDYIPFLSSFVRRVAQRHRDWLSRHNFDRYSRLSTALPRLREALEPADIAIIASLVQTHYLFDQVVEITDAGLQRVYSLRVESPCHSFCANGFINHNTECRLTSIAEEMLQDIDKDTVDFIPNFDATLQEPTVLPAKLPNLLVNGASGIAVGMATNIPPHNLGEVCDAISYLIDHPDATVEDLCRGDTSGRPLLLGPDFPTGGIIMGLEGIKAAYATGKGRILVRARAFVEAFGDRQSIVITELPYQVNKAALLERIAELVKEGRIEGIADVRDESDRQGMRVVIELKRGVDAHTILGLLYKYTAMQTAFSVNMLALVDGEPRVLPLKRILQHYIDYRHQVLTRRTRFDLERAKARAHILEGLKIALDHLDEVIATIRQSPDAETAKARLMKRFGLDDLQSQAILDMQLRRLARLEREKVEQELKDTKKLIAYLEDLLAYPHKIYALIKDELRELKQKYGDKRRTSIYEQEAVELTAEDLIPDEKVVVAITQKGYLKRYRLPRRASKPTVSRETDPERDLCLVNMRDTVLFLTDAGRICGVRCHEIPEADRSDRGIPIGNLITLNGKESVVNLIPLPKETPADASLAIVTRHGKVKRTAISEFSAVRGGGIVAITLEDGDAPVAGRLMQNGDEFILVTRQGQAIRFPQEEVRAMGRAAAGVIAIRLEGPDDAVVAFDLTPSPPRNGEGLEVGSERPGEWSLLVVTAQGQGKRTPLTDFPSQGRAGSGVAFVKVSPKTGPVVAARVVDAGDEVVVSTSDGQSWRGPAEAIAQKARTHALAPIPELSLTGKNETVSGLSICPRGGAKGEEKPGSSGAAKPRKSRGRTCVSPLPGAEAKPSAKAASGEGEGTKARASPAAGRETKGRRKKETHLTTAAAAIPAAAAEAVNAQREAQPRTRPLAEAPTPADKVAKPEEPSPPKMPARKAKTPPPDGSTMQEETPPAHKAEAKTTRKTKRRSPDDIKVRFKGQTIWLSRE